MCIKLQIDIIMIGILYVVYTYINISHMSYVIPPVDRNYYLLYIYDPI